MSALPEIMTIASVTKLDARHRGVVLVGGSHGGLFASSLAAKAGVRAVILNDAGIGCERAGVAGLDYLGDLGIAAAAVDCRSARIGDGADMLARGRISSANALALGLGVAPGMSCRDAAERLRAAPASTKTPPDYAEGRFVLREGDPPVLGMDSNSLIVPEDAGKILVIGSHGALLAGNPASAINVQARAAAYSDAGIGIDEVGITRLPVLDARGIPCAAVDCMSARIGDARSQWATGVVSRVNRIAAAAGAAPGMSVQSFTALFARP
jgi:hypothetical protein